MVWKILFIALIVLLALLAIRATALARRLDSLNTEVTKSRRVLEHALLERARAAKRVATSGILDVAGGLILADAATEAIDTAVYPIVNDGLDVLFDSSAPRVASSQIDRLAIESELSRALRLTVDATDENAAFAELNEARSRVRLARRFHNSRVDQVRRVRRHRIVRIFHLTGRTRRPVTVDLDDE